MQIKYIVFAILFLASGIFYYQLTEPTFEIQTAKVIQVVDGDTLKTNNSQTLRLLGINTPEKNQPLYQEAKDFLTQAVQNKTIQIEPHGTDKYGRTLSYIFLDDKNINAQILSNGLATLYYYEHDNRYEELKQTEELARTNELGLWKKSPDAHCVQILEFKTDEPEILILQNICNKILNITYKDDATHIYKAILPPNSQHTQNFSHIWNTEGDSIYIYDTKGLLIFKRYN